MDLEPLSRGEFKYYGLTERSDVVLRVAYADSRSVSLDPAIIIHMIKFADCKVIEVDDQVDPEGESLLAEIANGYVDWYGQRYTILGILPQWRINIIEQSYRRSTTWN